MDGYLYIYCLPPAGVLHSQNKVIKCAAYGVAIMNRQREEGEGRVYEAYEVKNKRQKLRCLLLRRKKKNIFLLFMKSLLWKKFLNSADYTTCVVHQRRLSALRVRMQARKDSVGILSKHLLSHS